MMSPARAAYSGRDRAGLDAPDYSAGGGPECQWIIRAGVGQGWSSASSGDTAGFRLGLHRATSAIFHLAPRRVKRQLGQRAAASRGARCSWLKRAVGDG